MQKIPLEKLMKPTIKDKTKKLCLVCSSGGHFQQLYSLGKFWQQYPRFWVTFDKIDTHCFLENEKVYWAFYPTTRNLWNFFMNLFLRREVKKDYLGEYQLVLTLENFLF